MSDQRRICSDPIPLKHYAVRARPGRRKHRTAVLVASGVQAFAQAHGRASRARVWAVVFGFVTLLAITAPRAAARGRTLNVPPREVATLQAFRARFAALGRASSRARRSLTTTFFGRARLDSGFRNWGSRRPRAASIGCAYEAPRPGIPRFESVAERQVRLRKHPEVVHPCLAGSRSRSGLNMG